jgi:hypothetical protein
MTTDEQIRDPKKTIRNKKTGETATVETDNWTNGGFWITQRSSRVWLSTEKINEDWEVI